MKPNYSDLGFSNIMGPKLRLLVEEQLIDELKMYGILENQFKFDWSESCIEGHETDYLDGRVENFSGINVFNEKDEHVAEGWMEFIHEPAYDYFIAYWEFLDYLDSGRERSIKDESGIPLHIYNKIPEEVSDNYKDVLLKP